MPWRHQGSEDTPHLSIPLLLLILIPGQHPSERARKRHALRLRTRSCSRGDTFWTHYPECQDRDSALRQPRTDARQQRSSHPRERRLGLGVPFSGGRCHVLRIAWYPPDCPSQVTTDQIPYREAGLERSVILEITQNKLPAMVSTIAVPDFAKNIFRRCWSPDPAGRPPISWCYVSLVSKYASGPIPPPPIPSMAVPPRRSEDYAPTTGASTSSSPYNPYGGSSMSSPFSDRSLSPYNPYAESLPSPPESPPVQTPGSPWNPYSRVPQTAGPSTAFADVYTTTDRPAWEPSSQPSTPFGSFPGGTPGSRKTSNPFRVRLSLCIVWP